MLQLSHAIINRPVVSVRTGAVIATAIEPIINPNNLKVEGWYCEDAFSKETLVLQMQEVRDIIPQGIVVNDHDALSSSDDLIRLKDILAIHFELIDKPVVTTSKHRIGKVSDYALDVSGFYIQKLYVAQSLFKSFAGGSLIVDRTQVFEITSKKIVINEPLQGVKAGARAPLPATPTS